MSDIKSMDWIEIFLWYSCNIKCSFCYQWKLRLKFPENLDKEQVLCLLDKWIKEWKEFIIFSWWEPTLDNNLWFYISYAKKLWYKHIRVHTNWFKFKDYWYLSELFINGLTWVTISIHWYWYIQDNVSKVKGSFDNIIKALINFEKLKKNNSLFIIDTNTVICKENYKYLIFLFKFLHKFSISRRMLVYPYDLLIYNTIEKYNIMPEYKYYIKFINEILLFHENNWVKDFVLETLPYCIIDKKYHHFIEKNYKTSKTTFFIDWEKDQKLQYIQWKLKFDFCNKCSLNKKCFWFSSDYIKLFWHKHLPIKILF